MRKIHVLIPSLVATAGMPFVTLVGCGGNELHFDEEQELAHTFTDKETFYGGPWLLELKTYKFFGDFKDWVDFGTDGLWHFKISRFDILEQPVNFQVNAIVINDTRLTPVSSQTQCETTNNTYVNLGNVENVSTYLAHCNNITNDCIVSVYLTVRAQAACIVEWQK